MTISKNNLYILLLGLFFVSCIWIFLNHQNLFQFDFGVCLFKKTTTLPCPACGTTTAVTAIFDGDFSKALQINPLSFLAIILLIVIPFWIFLDIILKKESFYQFYIKVEEKFKKPIIYIPLILLIIANWIWNILKSQ